MLSYLKHKGFGVTVDAKTIAASQYADDAQVFLHNMTLIPQFLAAMAIFKSASGQGLNLDKTVLLPVGRASRHELWVAHYLTQLRSQFPQALPWQSSKRRPSLGRTGQLCPPTLLGMASL
jgi:hypothetical protein